jgi:hypothetical protein
MVVLFVRTWYLPPLEAVTEHLQMRLSHRGVDWLSIKWDCHIECWLTQYQIGYKFKLYTGVQDVEAWLYCMHGKFVTDVITSNSGSLYTSWNFEVSSSRSYNSLGVNLYLIWKYVYGVDGWHNGTHTRRFSRQLWHLFKQSFSWSQSVCGDLCVDISRACHRMVTVAINAHLFMWPISCENSLLC